MTRLSTLRRRTSIAASTILAATLFAVTASAPAATHAAGLTGPWTQAYVVCNTVSHSLTITPNAGAVDSLASQTIYYHYWLLDRTVNKYVAGWNPTGWGTIFHNHRYTVSISGEPTQIIVPGPIQGQPSVVTLTPGHSYSVYTEYWWQTNGSWASAGAWTTVYETSAYAWSVRGSSANACVV